jgi:ABC-type transport system involved in cytochrome c biogenesis permease component
MWRLVAKDLRVLWRSRVLVVALVAYPLVFAAIVAAVAREAGTRPRIAFVDADHLPAVVQVGGARVDYGAMLRDIRRRVNVVPMPLPRARSELASGGVVGVVIVPAGFLAALRTTVTPPAVQLETRGGPVGDRVVREVQAFVYTLNSSLQRELLAQNVSYLQTLVRGGTTDVLGRKVTVLGLDRTAAIVQQERARTTDPATRAQLDDVLGFAHDATAALGLAAPALRAVAHPVTLHEVRRGGGDLLSNRGLAVVIAVAAVLAGVLLGAGALASEREEGVIGRLVRLPRALDRLVAATIVFVTLVTFAIGAIVAVAGCALADLTGASAPWARLPAALVVLLAAGAATGAVGAFVGALVRDLAGAAFVALAAALPFLLAGLVPGGAAPVLDAAGAVFPFAPATHALAGVLYDAGPGGTLARGVVHLGLLALAFGGGARLLAPRLAR